MSLPLPLPPLSWPLTLLTLLLTLLLPTLLLALYRLYLHPLSHYPGPRLAAATKWHEFHHDVLLRGRFAWEIKRMHAVYGPVVRITPDELHINAPDFYDVLYAGGAEGKRRDKYPWAYDLPLLDGASWTTIQDEEHARRRKGVAGFFSLKSVLEGADAVVRRKLEVLSAKVEKGRGKGEVVCLDEAFVAAFTDVVTEYGLGVSMGLLEEEGEGYAAEWYGLLRSGSEQSLWAKHVPWVGRWARWLRVPEKWVVWVKPELGYAFAFSRVSLLLFIRPMYPSIHPSILHWQTSRASHPQEV